MGKYLLIGLYERISFEQINSLAVKALSKIVSYKYEGACSCDEI
jgi:hypothetical protein